MFSRRCLKIKTSLWRFVRSTCVIFLTEIRLLKGKRAFSNKNKTKQNRSESLRKWFLTIASIQRHPWEDFFGQQVIFLTEIRLLKGKMCIFKQEEEKQMRSESLRKWFLTIASIQRHPWEDFFGQQVIFLTEIRLLKGKMCIFKQEEEKQMRSESLRNWFLTVASTKTSLWRFIRSTSLIYFNRNNGPLKGKW